MTMTEDDREFINQGKTILEQEWHGSYEEEQTKMFLGLILTKYEELANTRVVPQEKREAKLGDVWVNPNTGHKVTVEDVHTIYKHDGPLVKFAFSDGRTSVCLMRSFVEGYRLFSGVAPQEPSECLCYGANGVTEPMCPACTVKDDLEKLAEAEFKDLPVGSIVTVEEHWYGTQAAILGNTEDGPRWWTTLDAPSGNGDGYTPGTMWSYYGEDDAKGVTLIRRGSVTLAAPVAIDEAKLAEAKYAVDSIHQIHGGTCLCGFSSARSRSRTEHITGALAELLEGGAR